MIPPHFVDLAPVVGIHMQPPPVHLEIELDLLLAEQREIEIAPGDRVLRSGVEPACAQCRVDPPFPCAVADILGALTDARLGGSVRQYREMANPAFPCEREIPEDMRDCPCPADSDTEALFVTYEERARVLAEPRTSDRGEQDDIALPALEPVHRADLELRSLLQFPWKVIVDQSLEERNLCVKRRDHTNATLIILLAKQQTEMRCDGFCFLMVL